MCRKLLMMAMMIGGLAVLNTAQAGEDRGMPDAHHPNGKGKTLTTKSPKSDKMPYYRTYRGSKALKKVVKPPPTPVNTVCPVTKKVLATPKVVREWNGKRVALLNAKAAARWDKYSNWKKAKRLAAVMKMKSKK